MRIPIPIRCKLFGRTLKVTYDPTLVNNKDVFGQAIYDTMEILLQCDTEAVPISQEALEQTFYHELVHHVLYLAGEDNYDPPLHKREYLVDRIACLLHQAFTTAEYEEKVKTGIDYKSYYEAIPILIDFITEQVHTGNKKAYETLKKWDNSRPGGDNAKKS